MENFCQIHCRETRLKNSYISSILFDDSTDLLWVGDSKGRVSSYNGSILSSYTSFHGSTTSVQQMMNNNRGILALGQKNLNLNTRNGLCKLSVSAKSVCDGFIDINNFHSFEAMTYTWNSSSSILLGGKMDSKLLEYDLNTQKTVSSFTHGPEVYSLKSCNKYLAVANANGSMDIIDSSSNNSIIKNFRSHKLSFTKIDFQNTTLVTTGVSKRNMYTNAATPDSLVNVYDLRYMKPMPLISFPPGAAFASVHPKLPNMCFVCSASGQLQFLDLFNVNNFKIYQVNMTQPNPVSSTYLPGMDPNNTASITNMELSNSGDFLCLADNCNTLYLWSADPNSHFNNGYQNRLDYPVDLESGKLNEFTINDFDKSLNYTGMPFYKEILLSSYPSNMVFEKGVIAKKIPLELVKNSLSTKNSHHIAGIHKERTYQLDLKYAEYQKFKYGPRNVHRGWINIDVDDRKDSIPKFISEKDDLTHDTHMCHTRRRAMLQSGRKRDELKKIFDYKVEQNNSYKVPAAFSKLHILYSKFGIEDFDFDFYNKSNKKFSGLQSDFKSSYGNSLLLLYRFIPELYNWVLESLKMDPFVYDKKDTKDSQSSGCYKFLLSELGYLYNMLSLSKGKICIPKNFYNCVKSIPEAEKLGLLNDNHFQKNINYESYDKFKNLIHSFNEFLLNRLLQDEIVLKGIYTEKATSQEHLSNISNFGSFTNIFGVNIETEIKSKSCFQTFRKTATFFTLNIKPTFTNREDIYLDDLLKLAGNTHSTLTSKAKFGKHGHNGGIANQTILPLIDSAMNKRDLEPIKVWCADCRKHQNMEVTKTMRNLPHVLSLNIDLLDEGETVRKISEDQINIIKKGQSSVHWLLGEFYGKLSNSSQRPILKLTASEFKTNSRVASLDETNNTRQELGTHSDLLKNSFRRGKVNNEIIKYELIGFVCEITGTTEDSLNEDKHLVTFAKIKETNDQYKWYLFNDFLVLPIDDENEVFNLSYWWKRPLIAVYQSSKAETDFRSLASASLDKEILYRDYFAKGTRELKMIEYKLLTRDEAPGPGSLMALDAEFVITESAKYIIKPDSTKLLVKPATLKLARVTVVRGDDGPLKETPFIDDYLVVDDPIEDYVTAFSGIQSGDLRISTSNKALTYSETTYRKIWLLLQIGVIFVGHGLANDFRAINIEVPENQIRDTLKLYYKKDVRRILGLKFLSYYVLNEEVQIGNHDSTEDAIYALRLYEKYLEWNKDHTFQRHLDNIYQIGSSFGFKVPKARK